MNLDDFTSYSTLDPSQMILSIRSLPEQIMNAWETGKNISLIDKPEISHVLIGGIGSTLTAARLLQNLLSRTCEIPVQSICSPHLPIYSGNHKTLLIISGYEGNEVELLKMFASGLEFGCQIVVLAKGGKLVELALRNEIPHIDYSHIGPARTALGFEFFLPLAVLCKCGLVTIQDDEILTTIETMRRTREHIDVKVPVVQNPAKRMAGQFLNRWITLMGSGFMGIVAERWKSQINENAKAWAQVEMIPEVCYSTLGGLYHPENQLTQMMALFLKSTCDYPSDQIVSDEVRKMFMIEGINTDSYLTQGKTALECMWNAILYGDFISYYLALAYDVDPTPVPGVEDFQNVLSKQ